MSQFSQLYMSRKAIQILLSLVSLFSFVLVSYSTVFLPLLSTFSTKLFSYSSERNYIFLLCNGILVFLIKNSGLTGNSSLVTDHINYNPVEETTTTETKQTALLVSIANCNENVNSYTKNEGEEAEQLLDIQEDESNYTEIDIQVPKIKAEVVIQEEPAETKQTSLLVSIANCNENVNSYIENEGEKAEQLLDIQEDESNHDNDEEGINELNKRCEEFIRRMKEDIKTEARQLITFH